jgi:hypothetical protein
MRWSEDQVTRPTTGLRRARGTGRSRSRRVATASARVALLSACNAGGSTEDAGGGAEGSGGEYFSPEQHYGISAVQFYRWDGASETAVIDGDPVEVLDD